MNYDEETLNCLILGILQDNPACNLTYMSDELKLPKTEIIKRIRCLCDNKFAIFKDNGFYTTAYGEDSAVSPQAVLHTDCITAEETNKAGFNWKECVYTPTPKSFLPNKK